MQKVELCRIKVGSLYQRHRLVPKRDGSNVVHVDTDLGVYRVQGFARSLPHRSLVVVLARDEKGFWQDLLVATQAAFAGEFRPLVGEPVPDKDAGSVAGGKFA